MLLFLLRLLLLFACISTCSENSARCSLLDLQLGM